MNKCTWKDCNKEAKYPQTSNDGNVWANLCAEHNKQLDDDITELKVKELVRDWILAQGGAKAAASRM